jgi:hypothetical protein
VTPVADVELLGVSVCEWLERKRLASLEPVFSEALLTYAAARHLVERGYEITAEENLGALDLEEFAKYRSCDLVARNPAMNANGGLAFEFKFLKGGKFGAPTQSFERISNDIVKLCCLSQDEWHRYLVLGYAASTKLYEKLTKEPLRFEIGGQGWDTLKPPENLKGPLSTSGVSGCSLSHVKAERGGMVVSIFKIEVHRAPT